MVPVTSVTVVIATKEKPGLSKNAYMGLVMMRFKGKVNGQEVMEIIKKLIREIKKQQII